MIKNFQKEFAIISQGVEFMITTGNYSSGFLNELPQNAGLSVTLERINYGRFFSFFRSVHRGKFFLENSEVFYIEFFNTHCKRN